MNDKSYPAWVYRKDVQAGAEYISCKHPIEPGEVVETKELREGLLIDIGADGKIVGVEILNGGARLNQ